MRYAATLSIGLTFFSYDVAAQPGGGFNPLGMAQSALAEPFVGITSDGTPEEGLYEIKQTGVPTAPVVDAARQLLESLNEKQRKAIQGIWLRSPSDVLAD